MDFNLKLIRKNYIVIVGLMILLVAGILVWISNARLESFHQYHIDIAHQSATGVENQVAFYAAEKRRLVELFAQDHIEQIKALAANPDNDELHKDLGDRLTRKFPDRFAFSVTDGSGIPRFEDFDGLISELCLTDVKEFLTGEDNYQPYIHPNSEAYHFDIMVRYGENGEEGIFFVSFLADVLGNILNSIQSPDHQIMLIQPQREDLIEVTAGGARNNWSRDDYRLSAEEQSRISMRHNISGTRWQAVDFNKPGLYTDYRNKLVIESTGIFLVFLTVALLLVARLRKEERQRELAEQQKNALMSVISHEFRSPTAIIKTALDFIAKGDIGKVDADSKELIDMALDSTSRLLLLSNDFLDIQEMESGNLKFDFKKAKLSSVVTDAVNQNKLYAKQFSCNYELKGPLADDYVVCDENRIEQVLSNFLSNAAKYGAKNDDIEVTVTRICMQLRVSVTDHGLGIPKDFQSRVFEKFTMASTQKQGQLVKSSGLGMSIARAIIEQHGGNIGFNTRTDTESGTTFWFELPIV